MNSIKRRDFVKLAACLGGMGAFGARAPSALAAGNDALSKQRVIMDSYATKNNDFFRSWARGVQEACDALNAENRDAVYNENADFQRSTFENAPVNGVEGIITDLYDAATEPAMVGLAQRLGIAIANNWCKAPWNTPLETGDLYCAYKTSNDVMGAQAACEAMFEAIGGKGTFVNVYGILGNSANDMRTEGAHRALKKYPGIEMVAEVAGGFNRERTQPVMEGVLAAHNKIDAVWCASDDSAIGAINALEARKMTALVSSIDGIPELLGMVKQGRAFQSVAIMGGWVAAYSTVQVFDFLNGFRASVPERMMYSGSILIDTPEAAATYIALNFDAPKFPFDYRQMSQALNPDSWNPQNILSPIDPEELWNTDSWNKTPKPSGYELPAPYKTMKADGSFDKVKKTYAAHFNKDPLAAVRSATRNKLVIV